jgi:hypothetical protein
MFVQKNQMAFEVVLVLGYGAMQFHRTMKKTAEFSTFVQCHAFVIYGIYIVIIKFDTAVFNWYDNSIILKPNFHFFLS